MRFHVFDLANFHKIGPILLCLLVIHLASVNYVAHLQKVMPLREEVFANRTLNKTGLVYEIRHLNLRIAHLERKKSRLFRELLKFRAKNKS